MLLFITEFIVTEAWLTRCISILIMNDMQVYYSEKVIQIRFLL